MTESDTGSRSAYRVVSIALKLLFVAILVLVIAHSAPQVIGAEESYVVLSGSMEPALSTGDVVIVYDADPTTIEEGDVITYSQSGEEIPVTHRVVEVLDEDGEELAFRTKGDANEDPDPVPVPASAVIGRIPAVSLPLVGPVLLRIPYLGYLLRFTGTGYGFLALIGVPIALLIANEAWSLSRSENTHDEGEGRTYTITGTDLRMTFAALVLLAVYSAYMAYRLQSPLSVAVAVAAIGFACLIGGLLYSGSEGSEPPEDPSLSENS